MKNNIKTTKSELACNITLAIVLLFTIVHLTIITLSFFNALKASLRENLNYITAYILVIVSLALYVFGFFIYKFTRLYMPAWFRIMFYIGFFLFTNIYYLFNLYAFTWGQVFLFAYISFLSSIICLSVYFNVMKDDKNKLKASTKNLLANVFFYSVALNSILQLIINLIKVILKSRLTNFSAYLVEFGTMTGVSLVMLGLFALSLLTNKSFINACLIKINRK